MHVCAAVLTVHRATTTTSATTPAIDPPTITQIMVTLQLRMDETTLSRRILIHTTRYQLLQY